MASSHPGGLFERILLSMGHEPADAKSIAAELGTLVITVAHRRLLQTADTQGTKVLTEKLALPPTTPAEAESLHKTFVDVCGQEKVGEAFREATEKVLGTYIKELLPSLRPEQRAALESLLKNPVSG